MLRSVAVGKVGLYTRLPERVEALERACKLVGVSCLALERQELTEHDSPFLRLLQLDKMGVPSVEVAEAVKEVGKRRAFDALNASPSHGNLMAGTSQRHIEEPHAFRERLKLGLLEMVQLDT